MQDRTLQAYRFLLQRTAGPYIGSFASTFARPPSGPLSTIPTLPAESWGADLDRLGRQDRSGRRPLAWAGLQTFVCTLVLEMCAWLEPKGPCWRLTQNSDQHQSSERQRAYSVVLKDWGGRSKP
jgi:hypothetical protein